MWHLNLSHETPSNQKQLPHNCTSVYGASQTIIENVQNCTSSLLKDINRSNLRRITTFFNLGKINFIKTILKITTVFIQIFSYSCTCEENYEKLYKEQILSRWIWKCLQIKNQAQRSFKTQDSNAQLGIFCTIVLHIIVRQGY